MKWLIAIGVVAAALIALFMLREPLLLIANILGPGGMLAVGLGCMFLLLFVGRVPLGYNLRNLMVRWRVTLMTALAFTLVIGLLVVMLAFVNGMYRLTESSGQPGNVIVLADGATDELFSSLGYGDTGDIEFSSDARPVVLTNAEGAPMVSRETYIVVNQPMPALPGEKPKRRFLQVRGIDDPAMSGAVHGLDIHEGGKWFDPKSGLQDLAGTGKDKEQAIQAVLGEGIARELGRDHGKPRLEVGDLFEVGARKWIVVGITKSFGSTFGSEIWAKRSLIGEMFGKGNIATAIVMRTGSGEKAKQLADGLTKNFKKSAVQAQPESEYYSKLSATNQQFLYAIIFVAVVMSVGGVFGVMNTMFAAISQRTRDIGVLRIIGFAPWQVLVSFFIESLWIALVGGAIGCALGFLANGWTASSIVSGGQGGGGKSVVFKLVVDATIICWGMLATLVMGGIGGLLPSLSAMRLKPLDAIR